MILLLSIVLFFQVEKPQPAFEFVASLQIDHQLFTTDVFGNIYLTQNREIKKYNQRLELTGNFSIPGSGIPASIDATDPFRLLVFYREFNQLIWLDNTLAPISGIINLNQITNTPPLAVCSSSKGGFWMIDDNDMKLKYFNKNLESRIENPIHDVFYNIPASTSVTMIEKNEKIWIGCNNQIFVFDLLGNYLYRLSLNFSKSFQVTSNKVIAFSEHTLTFGEISGLVSWVVVQAAGATDARIENNKLLVSKKGVIEIYSITNK